METLKIRKTLFIWKEQPSLIAYTLEALEFEKSTYVCSTITSEDFIGWSAYRYVCILSMCIS